MFHEEFYPTPREVAERMWKLTDPHRAVILDPSCGKGDLLEGLIKREFYWEDKNERYGYYVTPTKCYGIEIVPDLQSISRDKGITIIGSDFLEDKIDVFPDLILMNPPFSNGEKHLLKAWEVVDDGGRIVCLLNEQTIKNPHTFDRKKVVELIEQYGSVEYWGDCFSTAERKTNVHIACVVLNKPEDESRFNYDSKDFSFKKEDVPDFDISSLATTGKIGQYDLIQAWVDAHNNARLSFIELIKQFNKTKDYISIFTKHIELSEILEKGSSKSKYQDFSAQLRKRAWHYILEQTKIRDIATSKMRKDFDNFIEEQSEIAFTKENIVAVIEMFYVNQGVYLHQAIKDVFLKMISYDKENKIHWEGWKTNDNYKVNHKVILPDVICYRPESYWRSFTIKQESFLWDIDKAICFAINRDQKTITSLADAIDVAIKRHEKTKNMEDAQGESTFFEFKMHKKGTLHLWFKDEDVWSTFNIMAAAGLGWLPSNDIKHREAEEKEAVRRKKGFDALWVKREKEKAKQEKVRKKTQLMFSPPNERGQQFIDAIIKRFGNCTIHKEEVRFKHEGAETNHFFAYDNFSEVSVYHCNEKWESIQRADAVGYFDENDKITPPEKLVDIFYEELILWGFIVEKKSEEVKSEQQIPLF